MKWSPRFDIGRAGYVHTYRYPLVRFVLPNVRDLLDNIVLQNANTLKKKKNRISDTDLFAVGGKHDLFSANTAKRFAMIRKLRFNVV